MHEDNQQQTSHKEVTQYATTYDNQKPFIQVSLFILWRIKHKKYQPGSQLFFDEISKHIKLSKQHYKESLAFLEGAGMVVNEVVIADKVSPTLIERYGIL